MSIHGRNYVIQDLDDNPSNIGASTVGLELPIGKQVKIASNEIGICHECFGKNCTKCCSDP